MMAKVKVLQMLKVMAPGERSSAIEELLGRLKKTRDTWMQRNILEALLPFAPKGETKLRTEIRAILKSPHIGGTVRSGAAVRFDFLEL